mmetsp:Transcript_137967/g.428782  ORF Transcript_137967/g.428782 Transcript_137967/m.428782 type:complete len:313 (-) Transcript_137967:1750-2688(-)
MPRLHVAADQRVLDHGVLHRGMVAHEVEHELRRAALLAGQPLDVAPVAVRRLHAPEVLDGEAAIRVPREHRQQVHSAVRVADVVTCEELAQTTQGLLRVLAPEVREGVGIGDETHVPGAQLGAAARRDAQLPAGGLVLQDDVLEALLDRADAVVAIGVGEPDLHAGPGVEVADGRLPLDIQSRSAREPAHLVGAELHRDAGLADIEANGVSALPLHRQSRADTLRVDGAGALQLVMEAAAEKLRGQAPHLRRPRLLGAVDEHEQGRHRRRRRGLEDHCGDRGVSTLHNHGWGRVAVELDQGVPGLEDGLHGP